MLKILKKKIPDAPQCSIWQCTEYWPSVVEQCFSTAAGRREQSCSIEECRRTKLLSSGPPSDGVSFPNWRLDTRKSEEAVSLWPFRHVNNEQEKSTVRFVRSSNPIYYRVGSVLVVLLTVVNRTTCMHEHRIYAGVAAGYGYDAQ